VKFIKKEVFARNNLKTSINFNLKPDNDLSSPAIDIFLNQNQTSHFWMLRCLKEGFAKIEQIKFLKI